MLRNLTRSTAVLVALLGSSVFAQSTTTCISTGDFGHAQDTYAVLDFGPIRVWEGETAGGASLPLAMLPCNEDRDLDLFIRKSEEEGKPAAVGFRSVCGPGVQPTGVSFSFTQEEEKVVWRAYDIGGTLLDEQTTSDPGTPQVVGLSHPSGIMTVEIIGALICIDEICWRCSDDPRDGLCRDPSDYYEREDEEPQVELDGVVVTGAVLDGDTVPLQLVDCNEDGNLDIFVPWSEASGDRLAAVHIRDICPNAAAATQVELTVNALADDVIFRAYDDSDVLVDSQVAPAGFGPHNVVLTHAGGIRRVDISGAEVCIDEICVKCRTDEPDPGPCREAGDYYPVEGERPELVMAGVIVKGAVLNGSVVELQVTDCDSDGDQDIFVPWSESASADELAQIHFDDVCPDNAAPQQVEIVLTPFAGPVGLRAFDDSDALVDSALTPGGPGAVNVVLSSAAGIRRIELDGAEICIARICVECESDPGPDPRDPCRDADDYFDERGEVREVVMNGVIVESAVLDGSSVGLQIDDCDDNGDLDVFVPWSEAGADEQAEIHFDDVCPDNAAPTTVRILVTNYNGTVWFRAYDDFDNYLVTGSTPAVTGYHLVLLSDPAGIRRIEIVGSEVCIDKICVECTREETNPEDCVNAQDAYDMVQSLDVAFLGPVRVTQPIEPNGVPLPLETRDCDQDGNLELYIVQSQLAGTPARIYFPIGCSEEEPHPGTVRISFQSLSETVWRAYDGSGNGLTGATVPGDMSLQEVTLSHPDGIYYVEVFGVRICIDEICWDCEPLPSEDGFRRSDTNGNGDLELADAVKLLNFLFLGGPAPDCRDAADSDDSGDLGLSDAVRHLNFLFLGGLAPPGSDGCHPDPTPDNLGCDDPGACAK